MSYLCYTDGSCKKTPGNPGGWGLVLKSPDGVTAEKWGWAIRTTVLAMEITAVLEAFKLIPPHSSVTVFTDSQAAIDLCTRQLAIWRKNGWKNADIPEESVLRELSHLEEQKGLKVEWTWLRSHHGNPNNEKADHLANEGSRKARAELKESER